LLRIRKEAANRDIPVKSRYLADLIQQIGEGRISRNAGKDVLMEMAVTGKTPEEIIREKGLSQISDPAELQKIIRDVLSRNADAVQDYKKGSAKAIGFLMGQIMKASRGKANPNLARDILEEMLS
ncbi:MAG TPA: Asp-tRNA(Asn)/Glu-tRNA(Gln) amidotransferase GatCAB subunit B, partial [Clostridiales bacterium]|nr:Asp-tRNA(Asn)/Glu-tRNA(Gln) amidotransferase GatCAB subunit B [Clostridiales bacterium]